MISSSYQIRCCQNPLCGLRYPLEVNHPFGERCPRCLGSTIGVLTRDLSSESVSENNLPSIQLDALLDNVRSTWNVGAIFRTSDGLGVRKIYLCGITPTPENPAVLKTSLGAEKTIPWESLTNALTLAKRLIQEGAQLWALEQDNKAVPVSSARYESDQRIVLIVGNEVTGVDPELLELCQRIVYIPMLGKKRSLNVEVAFGVAVALIRNTGNL
jgi:23S rRNA (guanosine2251-2'-O)-methyltransferase